ncbi:MAG: Ppx/GppA phosphatase family protein [Candidatus Eremiobacterota bacterium]
MSSKKPLPLAAIDIGSNAARMVLAHAEGPERVKIVKTLREPLRLGKEVFASGTIGERGLARLLRCLERFRNQMDRSGTRLYRAVATSALREAEDREEVIQTVARQTGLEIQVIGGEEEARYVYLAIAREVPLNGRLAAMIDIGGGSVEITMSRNQEILAVDSLKLGTVRVLKRLQSGTDDPDFRQRLREYALANRGHLQKLTRRSAVEVCIGTGGNVEALGDLRCRLLGRESNGMLTREELDTLSKRLESMSYLERIEKLELRPDRADVILPAAIVLQTLMEVLRADHLLIPHVGLKDGVLRELVEEHFCENPSLTRQQAIQSALQMGDRHGFDRQHAQQVTDLALQLFDETRFLHQLGEEQRFLLEVAALLHDVGKAVNVSSHHKHSHYLVRHTPLFGLTMPQRIQVACVARYHRKAAPEPAHEELREVPPRDRQPIVILSALLRLAEALDAEHGGQVRRVEASQGKRRVTLYLEGPGGMLLERWAVQKTLAILERALGCPFRIRVKGPGRKADASAEAAQA